MGEDELGEKKIEYGSAEIRGWTEYCCWTVLFLTPILVSWNGTSVSADQAVVRKTLIVISAVAAVGLRVAAIIKKRSGRN